MVRPWPSSASPRPRGTSTRQTNEWKDGESLFLTCNVWRQAAENVAESLQRGMRVIVQGRLKQRSYETKEGEKRTVYEIEVDEVGPSLRSATAKVTKTQRGGGGGGFGGGGRRQRPVGLGGTGPRRRPAAARAAAVAAGGTHPAPPTSPPSDPPASLRPRIPSPIDHPGHRAGHPEIWSTTMAKPPPRKPKKKVCQFCKDKISYVDYKDTGAAAEVHLRPRQDPRPSGHRQLHAAPA